MLDTKYVLNFIMSKSSENSSSFDSVLKQLWAITTSNATFGVEDYITDICPAKAYKVLCLSVVRTLHFRKSYS